LFTVYFSGVVVTLLAFCSLIHLFSPGQNDKAEKIKKISKKKVLEITPFFLTHITIKSFNIKLLLPIFKIRGIEEKDKQ